MRLLLDTCTFLWIVGGDKALSARARAAFTDPDSEVFLSAASAWEIAVKHRLGKLPLPPDFISGLERVLASEGWTPLPVGIDHAQLAGSWPMEHRDPFDRMLAAQSKLERLALLTTDGAFEAFQIKTLW